jgi:hypothetical protein
MSILTLCSTIFPLDAAAQVQLNGTSPWDFISPGWATQPAGRGTMDIIWSCLITIFACSWTVTHPDFLDKEGQASSKMVVFVIAVLAPEILACVVLIEYGEARNNFKAIKQICNGRWSMSQQFFVHMGGVQSEFEDCTETLGCTADGDFYQRRALDVLQHALQLKILDTNVVPASDVEKRSESNQLVKALVCLQASWLVAQVIGRAVAKLLITTLEVVTVAYVICALVTYAFWWYKPQDPEHTIVVNCRSLTRARIYEQIDEVRDGAAVVGGMEFEADRDALDAQLGVDRERHSREGLRITPHSSFTTSVRSRSKSGGFGCWWSWG